MTNLGWSLKRTVFSNRRRIDAFVISDRCFRTGLKEQRKKKEEWMALSDFIDVYAISIYKI